MIVNTRIILEYKEGKTNKGLEPESVRIQSSMTKTSSNLEAQSSSNGSPALVTASTLCYRAGNQLGAVCERGLEDMLQCVLQRGRTAVQVDGFGVSGMVCLMERSDCVEVVKIEA